MKKFIIRPGPFILLLVLIAMLVSGTVSANVNTPYGNAISPILEYGSPTSPVMDAAQPCVMTTAAFFFDYKNSTYESNNPAMADRSRRSAVSDQNIIVFGLANDGSLLKSIMFNHTISQETWFIGVKYAAAYLIRDGYTVGQIAYEIDGENSHFTAGKWDINFQEVTASPAYLIRAFKDDSGMQAAAEEEMVGNNAVDNFIGAVDSIEAITSPKITDPKADYSAAIFTRTDRVDDSHTYRPAAVNRYEVAKTDYFGGHFDRQLIMNIG